MQFTQIHLWLRIPQVLVVPLKVLPRRFLFLFPSSEDVLPCPGNHLMDLLWVGCQCPDFFCRLIVALLLQDSHLGSAFIPDPLKEQC